VKLDTTPLWLATEPACTFGTAARRLDADVAIVGAGVTGLTAAALLSRSGWRVTVLERDRVGSGETGRTTSHLTEAVDAHYHTLVRDFGLDAARLVAESSRDAMAWIEASASALGINVERTPGYLYTERDADVDLLARELDAARRAGCSVQLTDETPLPFPARGAVRWEAQAQVHASEYLFALANDAVARGVEIVEQAPVKHVQEGEPCLVETERFTIRAPHVLVAANVPVNHSVFLHTRNFAYRTYVVAAEVPAGYLRGLFWDTDDPYHYTRVQEVHGTSCLMVGGADHRTGEESETEACYAQLLEYARTRFSTGPLRYRWSGQIIEPVDGLPFIGPNSRGSRVFVATGYAGTGMTFGTLAGMMFADVVNGKANPYASLYDPGRVKPLAGAYDYVVENAPFPLHLLKDRLTSGADIRTVGDLRPGEGGIFAGPAGKMAACRDVRGEIHACSAICTHLACDVVWNAAEQTWDCPCHGSRFSPDGRVLNGPAVADLRPIPVPARSK